MTDTIKNTKELAVYKNQLSKIETSANALSIKTEAEIKDASDILFQVSEVSKRLTNEKEKITKPLNEALKNARSLFAPLLTQCENAERIIKDKMIAFDAKKQAEALKKLNAVADKLSEGKISLEKASEKIDGLKPVNSYSGDSGAIQFRINRVAVITDESKLPRKYLEPNMVVIRAALLAGEVIPGAEIKEEKIVAKSSR